MEVLRDQMTALLEQGLYDSAEILGGFLMSATASNSDLPPSTRAENMVLLADALYGRKEYRRALNLYRQAVQQCRVTPKQTVSGGRSSVQATSRPPSVNSLHASTINENEVKYKIGLCHLAVHDTRAALSEMEGIPPKARNLKINLTLAKLYRSTGYDRAATAAYKECLRISPYVLEAVIALAELGVAAKELHSLLPQVGVRKMSSTFGHVLSTRKVQPKSIRSPVDPFEPVRWFQRLADGHCSVYGHNYKEALEHFNYLGQKFPNNVHVLLETAKAEAAMGRNDEAVHNFEKARQADQYNISSMDEYAMLLRTRSNQVELNRLVHDLLNIDPARPEVWVASAVYWELRDDRVRALTYTDKAMRIDERLTSAHLVKGNLSLSLNRSEVAVMAFRKAQSLRTDLRAYQGLVRAHLANSKHKEALCAAREAMKAMPHSAKALTLVGDVYAQNSEGRDKGRKFYESALRQEPGYLGAVLSLADLHGAEGRNDEAIALLQRYLKTWADDSLHTKLAQILAASNKLGESLSHYQTALSINPLNEAAKKGLERLEKQMKGVDPDALDEEEDNEGEDADADAEEGEFL
ncbi:anaphase-promoting complex subunit 7 [Marchantia polymorpha subsp. ruderalis]|uniref:Anaphase-promoting complex subunit 7 n=2 Tax=Marchantia polymorpha TaxID=3197 RepID=A0AAF6BJT1_MARPO|nr:hypothetical protein MARPO_0073s0077 [Marchantia polymorpha]BBN12265.1 hypothetical protein Mp_5g18630 [Marchantia polymorpha subsp. ruderalis]|eukprot:PTQ35210.1 hypothetical protein MARPO_0073s0077 [Marchantia polymorpha]